MDDIDWTSRLRFRPLKTWIFVINFIIFRSDIAYRMINQNLNSCWSIFYLWIWFNFSWVVEDSLTSILIKTASYKLQYSHFSNTSSSSLRFHIEHHIIVQTAVLLIDTPHTYFTTPNSLRFQIQHDGIVQTTVLLRALHHLDALLTKTLHPAHHLQLIFFLFFLNLKQSIIWNFFFYFLKIERRYIEFPTYKANLRTQWNIDQPEKLFGTKPSSKLTSIGSSGFVSMVDINCHRAMKTPVRPMPALE